MSKLMEQVKEIQRKAHVCPECNGTKQVANLDVDTLVAVIERLARPFVASHKTNDAETAIAVMEADRLVNDGLPDVERAIAVMEAEK